MAILKREEYFNRLQDYVGDDSSDKAISLIEDMTDTYNALIDTDKDKVDWESKYKENDKAWRDRYARRFFTGASNMPEQEEEPEEKVTPENIGFDNIFTTK